MALEIALEKKDPRRKLARRLRRQARKEEKAKVSEGPRPEWNPPARRIFVVGGLSQSDVGVGAGPKCASRHQGIKAVSYFPGGGNVRILE